MFNIAPNFATKFKVRMEDDFKAQPFASSCPNFLMHFKNDDGGKWADTVMIRGGTHAWPTWYFSLYFSKLPGNCGIGVVSSLRVGEIFQKNGIGTWLMKWMSIIFQESGYTIVIGTTNPEQAVMAKLLTRHGWQNVENMGFVNWRTKNEIKFWKFEVPEPNKKDQVMVNHNIGDII